MVTPIRLLALDIDGVITDGTCGLEGEQGLAKRIAFHDLDAVTAVRRSGLDVVMVTAENDEVVRAVARRFGVTRVISGAKNKLEGLEAIAVERDIPLEAMCYVGDSDRDAPALARVGLGLAPANATPTARAAAHRVLDRAGGAGAVAEAVRLLVRLQGLGEGLEARKAAVERIVRDSIEAHRRLLGGSIPVIAAIAGEVARSLASGRKLLLLGNGGSAADAQHVAGELVGRFARESEPWPVVALTTDSSILTCVANDWSYEDVFARQVRAHARPGDMVAGISTSGRSPNVLAALRAARQRGAITVGFAGSDPGLMGELCDHCFCAPSKETPRIQELHILAWHSVCELVEAELMGSEEVGPA